MIRIIATLLMLTASLMADGGLYVHDREKKTIQALDDGYLVVRHPMQRVVITHAILRYDTDDKKIIWLELHMNELRDSGDFYYCESVPERTQERQFHTRSSEFHDKGTKWALRFDTIKDARISLNKIKTAYGLDDKHSIDKTEG
jgi:hypothetical protein